jgi:Na+-driven multidrug efflux pump
MPYFLCGIMEVCTGILRGLGRSMLSMFISLVGACLLRVVWLWTVFPMFYTMEAISLSYPFTWIVTALTAFTFIQILLRGLLKHRK